MRENDFLKWIQLNSPAHPRVPLPIGDDMAAVLLSPQSSALSTPHSPLLKIDQALDQLHFDLRLHSPAQAAAKAVNRCLSDCAAMAASPSAIMLSLALPQNVTDPFAQQLFLAAQAAAALFDCPLVGGDTSIWNHPEGRLVITVAALGTYSPTPFNPHPITRSGGQPGDTLFVSGSLGGSILSRHLDFTPRIRLAQKLAAALPLHAMMDLSDGLSQDLPRLATASGTGAILFPHRFPLHPDAHTLADRDHLPAALHALADGEDYELLLAIDPDDTPALAALSEREIAAGRPGLTAIGTLTQSPALLLQSATAQQTPWPNLGWQHASK